MFQLTPKERFPIARQLDNASDPSTYYLRATIKDADGTTIDTVDLTHIANHYYSKTWEVSADPGQEGRFITITVKVYDDAGYSTLSGVYAATSETYLIQKRLVYNLVGGGGGADISYKKIEDIVNKGVGKIKIPDKKIDLSPIEENINRLHEHVGKVEGKIDEVKSQVASIEIPKPEPVDLSDVIGGIQQIADYLQDMQATILQHINSKSDDSKNEIMDDILIKNSDTLRTLTNEIQTARDMILKIPNILDTISKLKETLSSKDLMGISDELKKINLVIGGQQEEVAPISFREKLGIQ